MREWGNDFVSIHPRLGVAWLGRTSKRHAGKTRRRGAEGSMCLLGRWRFAQMEDWWMDEADERELVGA